MWMLLSVIYFALKAPVRQVINRSRPAYIIVFAVSCAIKAVVASIYIKPVIENVWFSVRNIFVTWEIGVKNLFHRLFPSFYI